MKKIIVLCILVSCLFGCGKITNVKYDFKVLEPKLQELFPNASSSSLEMLSNKYDVDTTYIEEAFLLLPTLADNADMVLIVKPKEGHHKEAKESLDSLFELLKMQYELYYQEEYEKIANKIYKEQDGYLIYIVSSDAKDALDTINQNH